MTEGLSAFAQEDVPHIKYFSITPEQAGYALKAASTLVGYEVTLLPIDTMEGALLAAQERAAHLQAERDAQAKAMGAYLVYSTLTEPTPEEFAAQLYRERDTWLFMRVRLPRDASLYELLREYYEPPTGSENDSEQ